MKLTQRFYIVLRCEHGFMLYDAVDKSYCFVKQLPPQQMELPV